MKSGHSISRILGTSMIALIPPSLAAEITFSGVLVSGGTVHVILIDSTSGRSSGWIQVGQTFERHTITRYEPQSERLIVSLGQEERFLPLTAGRKIAPQAKTLKIGSKEYQIYSDTEEKKGDLLVFRGNVTGISAGAHFSCDEVQVEGERVTLVGAVKLQQRGSLIRAKNLRIAP
jgi:hypothetical protein